MKFPKVVPAPPAKPLPPTRVRLVGADYVPALKAWEYLVVGWAKNGDVQITCCGQSVVLTAAMLNTGRHWEVVE